VLCTSSSPGLSKTSDNLSQTKPLSLKKDEVFSWKGDGQIIVGYYLDEKAQIPTTAQNSGAAEKGGAPALQGQYYVKVTALEVEGFYQETSEIFPYQINFDVGIQDKSLQKIYAILFKEKISKSQRLSNWEADVLSDGQKQYAATDAWACLNIYNLLQELKQTGDWEVSPLTATVSPAEEVISNKISD
jgi:hypothetical protein